MTAPVLSWKTGMLAAGVLGFFAITASLTGCGLLRAPAPVQAAGSATQAGADAAPSVVARQIVTVGSLSDPAGKFFGLEANGAPDSLGPVLNVAANIDCRPDLLGQYVAWNAPFDATAAARSVSYGALYYMAWEPFDTTVRAIADGASDSYIARFARAVRDFGHPMALSFGHEMNGNWYPWGTTGTTAAEFVAAWRRIHDLFVANGADNVIWVWNPNVINPVPDVQLRPYWPGAAYVDWVGITGYFATTGPHTFDGLYGPTMAEIRQFTAKPFIIAETAVETGPDEAESVRNLIAGVEEHSDVLGLIWFNYDVGGVDWTLNGRPLVRAAMAESLAGMRLVSVYR